MPNRALLIGVPGGGINVSLAARRLTPVLRELGFSIIETRTDDRATRQGILGGLDRLIRNCEPGDAIFVHYFGHGGRVRFTDLHSEQVFGYVTCTKQVRGGGFEAVLDRELSDRFTALDARCGNVTVMFDCCYSAELVRSGEGSRDPQRTSLSTQRSEAAPAWAQEVLAAAPTHELALDSHPQILRLCGASPKREAFAAVRGGRNIGYLTEAFIASIAEAGDDAARLSWVSLAHRVREHVIGALSMESQWVAVAGPRTRRLFSTKVVALPGSVAFIPGDVADSGWLRAGWQQGVAVGDRWALLDPCVDEAGDAQRVAELLVTEVKRNRASVELQGQPSMELHAGTPAVVLALHDPMRVAVEDPALRAALGGSAWLGLADPNADAPAPARVRSEGQQLVIEATDDTAVAVRLPADPDSHRRALALLEDRARIHTLLRGLASGESSPCPLRWRWSLVGQPDAALPESGATLRAGDRIRVDIELDADGPPTKWFVSVMLIDPAGRPRLLNTRMPEGLELTPGDAEVIGVRHGRRGAQGIELRWPDELELVADEGPASLLILASRRPIELAHIVRPQVLDEDDALALQGLAGELLRDRKPEHTRGCAWGRLDFRLRRS